MLNMYQVDPFQDLVQISFILSAQFCSVNLVSALRFVTYQIWSYSTMFLGGCYVQTRITH